MRVSEGDILLVGTGRDARRDEHGPWSPMDEGLAGLAPECIPWTHERGVAVIGCDGITDASPSETSGWRLPYHEIAIVSMGVHLIDNMQLGRLAAACAERGALGVPADGRAAAARSGHRFAGQPDRDVLSRPRER